MARNPPDLAIDARPRGPRGALAVELVRGRGVIDHLLDLAAAASDGSRPVSVHARADDHPAIAVALALWPAGRFVLAEGPPRDGSAVLRADRLYDAPRLRRAVRRGRDPETAAIWRLDRPETLEAAGDELARRQSYQPLGRYWALGPARRLARALAPTRVRPNAVTLASAALMAAASCVVAFATPGVAANLGAAAMLAAALVLDTADGHLARLQGTATAFGRWLDAWLDELCDMALHAAVAWSLYARSGSAGWLLVGMLYAMGKYVFVVGATAAGEPGGVATTRAEPPGRSLVRDAVRFLGHADVRWHLWVVLAAAGRLDAALAAYAVYFPARSLLGAAGKAARRA